MNSKTMIVESVQEARSIARSYACRVGVNETTAEAFADVWFDAGKDDDESTADFLRAHLGRKFGIA